MHVRLIRPDELSAPDREVWLRMLHASPRLDSPYFHPDFALEIARVRPNARLAVIHDAGAEPRAFFAYEQRGAAAQPLGGRLSDYQGLVRFPEWSCDPLSLARTLGMSRIEFDHWIAEDAEIEPHTWFTDGSPVMEIQGGWEAYQARRCRPESREVSTARRKARKLAREVGPLRFEFHSQHNDDVLEHLFAWKSAQYQRTQVTDVFAYSWTRDLIASLLRRRDPGFQGVLSALYAGSRLVAVHFGMQANGVLHYWFPAYDPDLHGYSPGLALLLQLVESGDACGVRMVDFGRGMARYKTAMMTGVRTVRIGAVECNPVAKTLRGSLRAAKAWLKQSPLAGPARIPGKLLYRIREWMAFRA